MSFAIPGAGGASTPHVISGASSYGSPAAKMNTSYQQIDTGNAGSINLAQFQQAFTALNPPTSFRAQGANAIFSQLDPNGTGSVSKPDFVRGMSGLMKSLRNGGAASATASPASSTASNAAARRGCCPSTQENARTLAGGFGTAERQDWPAREPGYEAPKGTDPLNKAAAASCNIFVPDGVSKSLANVPNLV